MSDLVESFSGIRGVYGESLTEETARAYAHSFLQWHRQNGRKNPKLVVGRDTRLSGEALAKAFTDAFVVAGCAVVDVNVSSVPATEHAVRHFGCHGGVMITASHNPPEFNGWKLLRADGAILQPADIETVINTVHSGEIQAMRAEGGNRVDKHRENIDAYVDFVMGIAGHEWVEKIKQKGMTILVDHNGGSSIPFVKPLLDALGVTMLELNAEPGVFNRQIEPTIESLAYLAPKMQETNADFAIGFDADADRAEIVLKDGGLVSGQHVLGMVVESVLSCREKPAETVAVFNDVTSDMVREIAEKYGARVEEVEVGEVNVVNRMQETGSPVGGEGSNGGCIIAPQTCRDSLLACSVIVRHLAETGLTLAELLATYPRFYTLNQKVQFSKNPNIRENLKNYFSAQSGVTITTTGDEFGGIKIRYEDGAWVWFRQSRTEPGIMRVFAESRDAARARELLALGVNSLEISDR